MFCRSAGGAIIFAESYLSLELGPSPGAAATAQERRIIEKTDSFLLVQSNCLSKQVLIRLNLSIRLYN